MLPCGNFFRVERAFLVYEDPLPVMWKPAFLAADVSASCKIGETVGEVTTFKLTGMYYLAVILSLLKIMSASRPLINSAADSLVCTFRMTNGNVLMPVIWPKQL